MGLSLSNCNTTLHDHAVYTAHFYSKNVSYFEGGKEAESEEKQKENLLFLYFFVFLFLVNYNSCVWVWGNGFYCRDVLTCKFKLPTWCTDYYLFIKYYSPLHVSSIKCSSSGGHSCIHAAYGTVTLCESSWWPVDTQLEWELTVGGRLLVGLT